jgi:outer membrane protein OmpA-like peptidoglycan-associated protein
VYPLVETECQREHSETGAGEAQTRPQCRAREEQGNSFMSRAIPVILGALLVAGCMEGPPPRTAYYYPPPPPGQRPPPAASRPAPPVRVAASPKTVKPLGAGVLAANVVEGYMDNQETEMRAALHGSGVIVARTGNDLLLNIRSDSLFEPESLALSAHGAEVLAHLAMVARKFDSTLLVANGFTDTTGSRAQNLTVSQKRADAVIKQLADDGVEQKRLAAKGFGDEILKIPTGPNVSEARNRRIEIRITPLVKT